MRMTIYRVLGTSILQTVYYNTFPLTLYFQEQFKKFTVLTMPRMPLNMN